MNETFEEKKHISELNPEISDENEKYSSYYQLETSIRKN